LLLLFARNKQNRVLGLFYILLWLGWGVLIFKMQRMPFIRNMIIHYSNSLAIIVYTFYTLVSALFAYVRHKNTRTTLITTVVIVPVFWLCCNQYKWCMLPQNFSEEVTIKQHITSELAAIGKEHAIAVSDWSTPYLYFGQKAGYKVSLCPTGKEDYYVLYKDEPIPGIIAEQFVLVKHTDEGYDIYRRK
jgi:hypothetical protein